MSTSETKEKEARLLSPSAQASLVIYNKIIINVNFGSKKEQKESKQPQ
jgi:hypothetical protein